MGWCLSGWGPAELASEMESMTVSFRPPLPPPFPLPGSKSLSDLVLGWEEAKVDQRGDVKKREGK